MKENREERYQYQNINEKFSPLFSCILLFLFFLLTHHIVTLHTLPWPLFTCPHTLSWNVSHLLKASLSILADQLSEKEREETSVGKQQEEEKEEEKDEKERGWVEEKMIGGTSCVGLVQVTRELMRLSFLLSLPIYSLWVLHCIWIWSPHKWRLSSDHDTRVKTDPCPSPSPFSCNTTRYHHHPLISLHVSTSIIHHPIIPAPAASPSTTQHHAAPRNTTQHHIIPRSTTQHHAAPRSTTQHHAAPRSTTQYTQHHAASRSITQLYPYVTYTLHLWGAILLHTSLVHQFWKIFKLHDQNKVTAIKVCTGEEGEEGMRRERTRIWRW